MNPPTVRTKVRQTIELIIFEWTRKIAPSPKQTSCLLHSWKVLQIEEGNLMHWSIIYRKDKMKIFNQLYINHRNTIEINFQLTYSWRQYPKALRRALNKRQAHTYTHNSSYKFHCQSNVDEAKRDRFNLGEFSLKLIVFISASFINLIILHKIYMVWKFWKI